MNEREVYMFLEPTLTKSIISASIYLRINIADARKKNKRKRSLWFPSTFEPAVFAPFSARMSLAAPRRPLVLFCRRSCARGWQTALDSRNSLYTRVVLCVCVVSSAHCSDLDCARGDRASCSRKCCFVLLAAIKSRVYILLRLLYGKRLLSILFVLFICLSNVWAEWKMIIWKIWKVRAIACSYYLQYIANIPSNLLQIVQFLRGNLRPECIYHEV